MKIRTFLSKLLFPSSIAVTVSFFLLREIEIQDIPATLGRMPITGLAIGFILYCLLVWTKSLRFRELLGLDVSVNQITPILALHTFWGNLLPMRGGDLSYIYLMKRRAGVDETKSVASLMLASVIDLMLFMVLMSSTGWVLRSALLGQLSHLTLFVTPLLISCGLAIVMATACLAPSACVRLANSLAKPLLALRNRGLTWFVHKCLDVMCELTRLRFDWQFLKIWGYSLLSLGLRFGFQCFLAREIGIEICVVKLLFALTFASILNLLPIQSVGNFGTVELPFVWVLMRFGIAKEISIVAAFSLHLIILLYCIPLGVYGLIKRPRRSPKDEIPTRKRIRLRSDKP